MDGKREQHLITSTIDHPRAVGSSKPLLVVQEGKNLVRAEKKILGLLDKATQNELAFGLARFISAIEKEFGAGGTEPPKVNAKLVGQQPGA